MPRRSILLALLALACVAAPAEGASRLVVRGAGFGHGVGLSQYGAYGYATRGYDHRAILARYYTGTSVTRLSGAREVRVLLQTRPRISFTGATRAGERRLDPGRTYRVTAAAGGAVTLRSATNRSLATYAAPLQIQGSTTGFLLRGRSGNGVTDGRYRDRLEVRPGAFGGLAAINAIGLESYVRGVVAGESPASWPQAALRAQAVVARTYAITTSKSGNGFDQYADTRSQVYSGIAGERPTTDAAVAATAGEVVTYLGEPVVTYYFSTSGGRTENVENSFIGSDPKPWLRSVEDPFDDASPRHRWVVRMSLGRAKRRLRGLVKGGLRQIKVLRRGRSPRVVRAEVVGTGGRTLVTGPRLRSRLKLFDTWASFTVITAKAHNGDGAPAPTPTPEPDDGGTPAGGAAPSVARAARRIGGIAGRVAPGGAGRWLAVQRRSGQGWVTLFETRTRPGGRYRAAVTQPGAYRIRYRGESGPPVRVR